MGGGGLLRLLLLYSILQYHLRSFIFILTFPCVKMGNVHVWAMLEALVTHAQIFILNLALKRSKSQDYSLPLTCLICPPFCPECSFDHSRQPRVVGTCPTRVPAPVNSSRCCLDYSAWTPLTACGIPTSPDTVCWISPARLHMWTQSNQMTQSFRW